MTTAITKYQEPNFDELEAEAAKVQTSRGGVFLKLDEGNTVLRFFPALAGKPWMKSWHKHFFQVGDERRNIICARMQANEPCVVCDKAKKMLSSGNRLDSKSAKALEPKPYFYVNCIDMKNPEKGVQVWSMSGNIYKDLLTAVSMAEVKQVFTNPKTGFNIIVNRVGKGQHDTRYKIAVARVATELPDAEAIIESQHDLESMETLPSDEEADEAAEGKFEQKSWGKGAPKEAKGKRADVEDADITY